MKEGWEYKKLGEVCEILDSQRKPITKGKREPGAIPYYGATGCLDYVKDYIFDEKLVLLGEDGAKWGAGDNSAYIINGKSWVNNHAHALRPKRDLLIDELLVYYLNFSNLLPYITGVTVPKLNQEKMRSIEIPIGPLKEQQSIVDYLDSAFAKIDAMKANAEKALNEAKALFQASLKEMLEPKEGWEEKKLKEIAQIKIGPFGSLLHKKDYISGGVPLVNPIHMVNGHIAIDNNYTILESKAKELSSYRLKENDIVFARRGEIGRCALVGEKENTYLCGTGSLFVRFNQEVDYGFMLLLFQSKYCKEYLEKQATGATMLNINSAIVGDMPIKYPHIHIQQSIVATLDSLKSKVDRLKANYDKISQECDALKQAILRQVFE